MGDFWKKFASGAIIRHGQTFTVQKGEPVLTGALTRKGRSSTMIFQEDISDEDAE